MTRRHLRGSSNRARPMHQRYPQHQTEGRGKKQCARDVPIHSIPFLIHDSAPHLGLSRRHGSCHTVTSPDPQEPPGAKDAPCEKLVFYLPIAGNRSLDSLVRTRGESTPFGHPGLTSKRSPHQQLAPLQSKLQMSSCSRIARSAARALLSASQGSGSGMHPAAWPERPCHGQAPSLPVRLGGAPLLTPLALNAR